MDTTINGPTMYCVHTDEWSRIRAVPVNATAVFKMLIYFLCKSSLASEIAVRDHMYHNKIYLFSWSLPPVLIWTNSFGTLCIVIWYVLHWSFNLVKYLNIPLRLFHLLRLFTLCQSRTYTPGIYNPNAASQMPVGEQYTVDQNSRQIHKGRAPWMCGQYNVRATTVDNIGQNTKDTHPVPE